MSLGNELFRIRKESGYSREEVGNETEITYQQIEKYEKSKTLPSHKSLKKLLKFLDVRICLKYKNQNFRSYDLDSVIRVKFTHKGFVKLKKHYDSAKNPNKELKNILLEDLKELTNHRCMYNMKMSEFMFVFGTIPKTKRKDYYIGDILILDEI